LKIILLAGTDIGAYTVKGLQGSPVAEVVGVAAVDDVVRKAAQDAGMNLLNYDDVNSESFISKVKELQAELLVNVICLKRYRSKILETPRFGVANVHPSLLPYYRGRDCIRWAMINGEKEVGITVHRMDESLDTGPIIAQEKILIKTEDYFLDVRERVKGSYPKIILQAIQNLSSNAFRLKTQTLEEGTYFPHRRKEDGKINWTDSSVNIYNLIRASCEPGFYAHTHLGGKQLFISKCNLRPGNPYERLHAPNSQLCGLTLDYDPYDKSGSSMLVGTGDGAISVERCGFEVSGVEERGVDKLRRGDRFG
jgi:methionyl-tRNA formyltransferase